MRLAGVYTDTRDKQTLTAETNTDTRTRGSRAGAFNGEDNTGKRTSARHTGKGEKGKARPHGRLLTGAAGVSGKDDFTPARCRYT